MAFEPEIFCEYGNGCRATVPLVAGMSLSDLREVLFSVTDVLPDRLVIVLDNGTELEPGSSDDDTSLDAVGIRAGVSLRVLDLPSRTTNPSVTRGAGPATPQPVTLEDLAAALSKSSLASSALGGATQRNSPADTARGETYVKKIMGYYAAVMEYENEKLQQKARELIPFEEIRNEAEKTSLDCPDASLCKALLVWYKNRFFKWVNSPDCESCGGKSSWVDYSEPTIAELRYRAGRVELYKCDSCGTLLRFPRYNDAGKLLETRQGRCGEWAQVFTLICMSVGLVTRCVHDETDHVWNEVWSHKNSCWMHADSCEASLNEPLLYESGWGKKLTYVVAVGRGSVADVTRRYTLKYDDVLSRRSIADERWLAEQLLRLNANAQSTLPYSEKAAAIARHERDMESLTGRAKSTPPPQAPELPGRQSGSADWIRRRGEDGSSRGDKSS